MCWNICHEMGLRIKFPFRIPAAGFFFERIRMVWNQFLTAFAAIFLAELGDKTQIAMITMSASSEHPLSTFLGGAIAMVLLTGIAVLAGEAVTRFIPSAVLSKIAAVLFVLIGIWTWFKG
jgi:putative Ca2+/H+ antiporter (TMEM165/GDT1 family)